MNLLNKNELLKLLLSPDIENRQIAETYLLLNFDLGFKVRYYINTFNSKSFCEIADNKTGGYTCSAKYLLYLIINYEYYKNCLKPLLDKIYEYNSK